MPVALACLLAFVAWTVSLTGLLVAWRSVDALRGTRRLDEFPAGVPHGTDAYWRLNRAHLNCVENLPIFGVVVLVAHALGAPVDPLAQAFVAARVGQTVTHLASGAPPAVLLRATFFMAQMGLVIAMIVAIVRATPG